MPMTTYIVTPLTQHDLEVHGGPVEVTAWDPITAAHYWMDGAAEGWTEDLCVDLLVEPGGHRFRVDARVKISHAVTAKRMRSEVA